MSEGLKNKMYDYEVTPPAKVWERINAALDESALEHEFPSTLYNIEVTPPAGVWNKIAASMDAEEEVVEQNQPKRRTISLFIKYAVAAAFIGLVAFGTIQLFKKGNSTRTAATEKTTTPTPDNIPSETTVNTTTPTTNSTVASTDEDRNDAALEDSKHTYAKLDVPVRERIRTATTNFFKGVPSLIGGSAISYTDEPPTDVHSGAAFAAMGHPDNKTSIADRYVMLMTPDGNIVRVSKKLGSLVCCVSGQEADDDCKGQLQCWREKVAGFAASPGNFIDILNMVNSLQEN